MRDINIHIDKKLASKKTKKTKEGAEIKTYSHFVEGKEKKMGLRHWVFTFLAIILVSIVSFLAISYREDNITPQQNFKKIAGTAIKQTTKVSNPSVEEKRYVSILVMGIDTRGVEFNGEEYIKQRSGTRKIDVVMQVLYDRKEQRLNFISIPRDTSLNVEEECMHQEKEDQKYINRIYDMAEKNDCPFSGPEAMMKYVSYITGYEIDDYVIITLDSFVDLISIVGEEHNGKKGIWIDVPRNIYDLCPNDHYGYNRVYFEKGLQFLTPKRALCYARVRKSSSDFDRNRRQQQVVSEVMHLITESETLSNPIQIFEIYNSQKDQIQMSDISLTDLTLGLEIMREVDLENIQKIVLDHEFGGTNSLLTKPRFSSPGTHTRPGGYYLIPTAWDKDCCKQDEWKLVREYLHRIIEDPDALNNAASTYSYVNAYRGDKQAIFDNPGYKDFKQKAEQNYIFFNESKYALPMFSDGPDIQVFDFSGGSKKGVAQEIARLANGKYYPGSQAPFKPINNEEIAIVVRVT